MPLFLCVLSVSNLCVFCFFFCIYILSISRFTTSIIFICKTQTSKQARKLSPFLLTSSYISTFSKSKIFFSNKCVSSFPIFFQVYQPTYSEQWQQQHKSMKPCLYTHSSYLCIHQGSFLSSCIGCVVIHTPITTSFISVY